MTERKLEMQTPTQAFNMSYCGVGVTINDHPKGVEITSVSVDSSLAGTLRMGDVLTAVREEGAKDWVSLEGRQVYEAQGLVRGGAGTRVELRVLSPDGTSSVVRGVRLPFRNQMMEGSWVFELRLAPEGTKECPMLLSDIAPLRGIRLVDVDGVSEPVAAGARLRSRISL